MRHFPQIAILSVGLSFLFTACRSTPPPATPLAITPEFQRVATQSMKILNAYWAKTPDQEKVSPLRLVYFVAADRDPLPQYQKRITGWFDDYQEFFRSEFARNGYGPRELNLERASRGQVRLHLVHGKKKDSDYSYSLSSGKEICREAREALQGVVNFDKETVMIICALSKTTDDGKIKLYAPYYGIGLGTPVKGTSLVVDQELLAVPNLAETGRQVTIAEHRDRTMSLGEYNTTYIGGTLHELGHALSLPHDYQTGAETSRGVTLMGSGNYTYRNDRRGKKPVTYLSFSEATRLLAQPIFSHRTCERDTIPKLEAGNVSIFPDSNSLSIQATLASKIPVYAAVAYVDKDGNDDYDSRTFVTAPDDKGKIYISITELAKGSGCIRLACCHANGAINQFCKYYKNAGDGTPIVFSDQPEKSVGGAVVKPVIRYVTRPSSPAVPVVPAAPPAKP
jgi:hypothetical protein